MNAKDRRRAARQEAHALTWPDHWLVFCKSCGWRPEQGHNGPCPSCRCRTFCIVPPLADDDELDLSRLRAADFGLLPANEAVLVWAQYAEWLRRIDGIGSPGSKLMSVFLDDMGLPN